MSVDIAQLGATLRRLRISSRRLVPFVWLLLAGCARAPDGPRLLLRYRASFDAVTVEVYSGSLQTPSSAVFVKLVLTGPTGMRLRWPALEQRLTGLTIERQYDEPPRRLQERTVRVRHVLLAPDSTAPPALRSLAWGWLDARDLSYGIRWFTTPTIPLAPLNPAAPKATAEDRTP